MRWRIVALALLLAGCGGPGGDGFGGAPAGATGGDPCDADGDGWLAAECRGLDCCDTDPEVRPDHEAYEAAPNDCTGWDWNCTGEAEPLEPWALAADCPAAAGPVECEQAEPLGGWIGVVPACGELGTLAGRCRWNETAPACEWTHVEAGTLQRCR